ncbi:protein kinase domain-containing protein [Gemmata sp.]|uniref:serine/threonine-protein kinase n=1 Tax=Gemmata sp. TaxID=1914242 RepID=UPI003F6FA9E9
MDHPTIGGAPDPNAPDPNPAPNRTLPAPPPPGAVAFAPSPDSTLPEAARGPAPGVPSAAGGDGGTVNQSPAEQAAAAAASLRPAGAVAIPGYEVLGELGRGGMGVVYKARQVALNRVVALKTILGGRVGPKDLARFLIEAEAVAAIEHPNVVRVYEYGDHEGQPYMALEFLPGGTLGDRIERAGGRLPPLAAARLVATVARGVAAAHALGIVHRDLKPANVLFGREDSAREDGGSGTGADGQTSAPKVADFGLAKRAASNLTQTQAVMGTPSYMAPEQADGRTKFVGPTADVWSLGVILYEALHGERPFQAGDVHGLLGMIRSADVPAYDPRARVPRELDLICRKCLEKNPADRYPAAAELADDLERYARGEPVTVRPLGPAARAARWAKRNPVVAGLLAAVAAFSVGLVGSLFAHYREALARAAFEQQAKEGAERLRDAAEELADAEKARRIEAEALRRRAEAEAARANKVSDFMTGVFRGSDPLDFFGSDVLPQNWEQQRTKTADVLLREAAATLATALRDQPLTRAKLSDAVANALVSFGDFRTAEPIVTEALALRRRHLPADHPDAVENELALGRLYWNLGDFPAALEWFRGAGAKLRRAGADEATVLNARFYEALALAFLDADGADAAFREVIDGRERLLGRDHKDTINARIGYAGMLLDQGRIGDALKVLPQVLAALAAQPSAQFRTVGEVISAFQTGVGLAQMAASAPGLSESLYRQAEAKLREALKKAEANMPVDHWFVGMIRFELAEALANQDRAAEAAAVDARLLEGMRRVYGFAHPKVLMVGCAVGNRLAAAGKVAEARKLWDDIDAANLRQFGPDNHWRGKLLFSRCAFEGQFGTAAAAHRYAEPALALARSGKVLGGRSACQPVLLAAKWYARPGLAEPGRAVARELLATARRMTCAAYGPGGREACIALRVEGEELYAMGDRAAGAERLAEAGALAAALRAGDDAERRDLLAALGRSENDRGRFAAAERHFAAAFALSRADWPADRVTDGWGLVAARAGQGKYAGAVPVLEALRRWAKGDVDAAWIDLCLAATHFAAGDPDEYAGGVRAMLKRYDAATEVHVLARCAWALGLSPAADPAAAAALAARAAPRVARYPKYAWGHWGLALVRLRAGDLDGADAALTAGGPVWGTPPRDWALHPIISGLCAAKRGRSEAARALLARAEAVGAADRPGEKNPFAYHDSDWGDRLLADLLLAELRAAVAPREPAPHPRPVER